MTSTSPRYDDLRALFINCTLKRSPEPSHTQGLIDVSAGIMRKQASGWTTIRAVDHDIATGVWPDMTEHGWATDEWPQLYPQGAGRRHPGARRADLAGRQQLGHQAGDRAAVRLLAPAQRRRPVRLLRPGRRLPDHRQRGRRQALRDERPLQPAAPRATPSRRRPTPAGSARPGRARPTSTPAPAARRTTSPTATPRS